MADKGTGHRKEDPWASKTSNRSWTSSSDPFSASAGKDSANDGSSSGRSSEQGAHGQHVCKYANICARVYSGKYARQECTVANTRIYVQECTVAAVPAGAANKVRLSNAFANTRAHVRMANAFANTQIYVQECTVANTRDKSVQWQTREYMCKNVQWQQFRPEQRTMCAWPTRLQIRKHMCKNVQWQIRETRVYSGKHAITCARMYSGSSSSRSSGQGAHGQRVCNYASTCALVQRVCNYASTCALVQRVCKYASTCALAQRVCKYANTCAHGQRVCKYASTCAHDQHVCKYANTCTHDQRVCKYASTCAHDQHVCKYANTCTRDQRVCKYASTCAHGQHACRVGQNHTYTYIYVYIYVYTVYIRYFKQRNHHTCGHIQCAYTVLANPICLQLSEYMCKNVRKPIKIA
jgi:hypothetical protein